MTEAHKAGQSVKSRRWRNVFYESGRGSVARCLRMHPAVDGIASYAVAATALWPRALGLIQSDMTR